MKTYYDLCVYLSVRYDKEFEVFTNMEWQSYNLLNASIKEIFWYYKQGFLREKKGGNMTKEQVFMMYFACGYRNAIYKSTDNICEVMSPTNGERIFLKLDGDPISGFMKYTKLILRKFEDMTGVEKKKFKIYKECVMLHPDDIKSTFYSTMEWIKDGFDIGGFIEQDYAINAKDLDNGDKKTMQDVKSWDDLMKFLSLYQVVPQCECWHTIYFSPENGFICKSCRTKILGFKIADDQTA